MILNLCTFLGHPVLCCSKDVYSMTQPLLIRMIMKMRWTMQALAVKLIDSSFVIKLIDSSFVKQQIV